ncbi:hypothetical protein IPH25_00405 [bacterium]|nr:MAG: hypothetical protein IPG37_02520 [bacterium]QQR61895.1 MAG: hypothetical protein IPH25_00405 [bacterium]
MNRYTCLLLLSFLTLQSFYTCIAQEVGSCISEKEYKNFKLNGLIDHLEKKKLNLTKDLFSEIADWQEIYFLKEVAQLIQNIYELKEHNKKTRNPLARKFSVNRLPCESEKHFILPKPVLDEDCIIYVPVYNKHGNIVDHWPEDYDNDRENDDTKKKMRTINSWQKTH